MAWISLIFWEAFGLEGKLQLLGLTALGPVSFLPLEANREYFITQNIGAYLFHQLMLTNKYIHICILLIIRNKTRIYWLACLPNVQVMRMNQKIKIPYHVQHACDHIQADESGSANEYSCATIDMCLCRIKCITFVQLGHLFYGKIDTISLHVCYEHYFMLYRVRKSATKNSFTIQDCK